MRSTLNLKFVILYIIFGFLSVFTVSALSSPLITNYLEKEMAGTMCQSATLMSSDYLPNYFSEKIDSADVHTQLKGMGSYLESTIWFVEKDGTMISSIRGEGMISVPDIIRDFDPLETRSKQYIIGNYHDYFKEDVITVITPVTEQFSIKGYLLIHKPYEQIIELKNVFTYRIFIILLVVYILSFLIFIGIHFFIYRPLCKITDAATQYASGNLDVVIPVNSQDEMGYLSASLNYMEIGRAHV